MRKRGETAVAMVTVATVMTVVAAAATMAPVLASKAGQTSTS